MERTAPALVHFKELPAVERVVRNPNLAAPAFGFDVDGLRHLTMLISFLLPTYLGVQVFIIA